MFLLLYQSSSQPVLLYWAWFSVYEKNICWFLCCALCKIEHNICFRRYDFRSTLVWKSLMCILFVTSNHQTTNLVFHEYFPVWAVEKKRNFSLVQNRFCLSCGPMKSLFSFWTAKSEKNSWKKLGKSRLVVWWFYVTNKIVDIYSLYIILTCQNAVFSYSHKKGFNP